jgi:predicted exporter
MDPLTNPIFIIFTALSPLLISFIKQSGWTRQVNALVALACYIVVGIVAMFFSGEELTLENAVNLIAVATVVGSAAYGLIWSNIGANEDGDASLESRLTEATSVVK